MGNACYNDWYLPAENQIYCLYTNRVAIGGFMVTNYWSSTEFATLPIYDARAQVFNSSGSKYAGAKTDNISVRCVRSFAP